MAAAFSSLIQYILAVFQYGVRIHILDKEVARTTKENLRCFVVRCLRNVLVLEEYYYHGHNVEPASWVPVLQRLNKKRLDSAGKTMAEGEIQT